MRKEGETRGRKTKDVEHQDCLQVIEGSAANASKLIRDLVSGARKRISYLRYEAAIYVLNQTLGKPTQKVTMRHTGSPITYQELSESADKVIKAAQEEGKTEADVIKEAEAVAAQAEKELDQGSDLGSEKP